MIHASWLGLLLTLGTRLVESLRQRSDEELVALARAQDAEAKRAFAVLVERHGAWLTRLLHGLVSNREDVEELVQNTMVRAFFALPKFRGEASFKTWLRIIATREAFNHYRRRGRRHLEVPHEEDAPEPEDEQALDAFTRQDERQLLEAALQRVPYPYREILVLRYIEELSLEEIGEALELGKSAAKMRLMRAREFFKSAYQQADDVTSTSR